VAAELQSAGLLSTPAKRSPRLLNHSDLSRLPYLDAVCTSSNFLFMILEATFLRAGVCSFTEAPRQALTTKPLHLQVVFHVHRWYGRACACSLSQRLAWAATRQSPPSSVDTWFPQGQKSRCRPPSRQHQLTSHAWKLNMARPPLHVPERLLCHRSTTTQCKTWRPTFPSRSDSSRSAGWGIQGRRRELLPES
jgi:hypothetical protein